MTTRSHLLTAGFTLLEMLVALAIFALLAVMSYSGLSSVMNQQVVTEEHAQRLGDLQKTYMLMQRDLEQVLLRPVRDEFGDVQPALAGSDVLQLTRGGWSNPLNRPRSSLQRVGYAWEDRQLVRYVWQVLDRAQDSEPLRQLLLDDIDSMEIRYLSPGAEWQSQWPEPVFNTSPDDPSPGLPLAVEVTLEHEHFGPLVWLFRMPL